MRAELAAGGEVYAAWPEHAGPVAALRVRRAERSWVISRISVLPGWRGTGLVRLLLAAVADRAAAAGVAELELAAVVERCLPALYAGLGFQVRDNWPSPGKPLSEVTMCRRCDGPVIPGRFGWQQAVFTEHDAVACWFLTGDRLVRVTVSASGTPLADTVRAARLLGEPGALLAGVDLSRQRPGDRDLVEPVAGDRRHPDHLMPRVRQPSTLAVWRPTPGRELPVAELVLEETG